MVIISLLRLLAGLRIPLQAAAQCNLEGMDSVEQVCDILETNGFDSKVVEAFRGNKVYWDTFTQLDKDDIKELGLQL